MCVSMGQINTFLDIQPKGERKEPVGDICYRQKLHNGINSDVFAWPRVIATR